MTLATTLPVTPTRRHQLPICVVLATASLLCGAADYKTPEFTDKKSRVSNVYICAVVGRKQGYEPNANKILAKFEIISKVSPERSSAWREDAELWWEKEHTNYDLKAFWAGLCAEPFDRIGKATSPASPQPVQVAEVATQEQIRSASCAITAMPKEVTERLI